MKKLSALAIIVLALGVTACDPNRRDVPVADGADNLAFDNGASISEDGLSPLQRANQEALIANAGDRVYFDLDSSSLDASDKDILNRQAAWLKTNGALTVTVEGHCDERGTREYNIALGERRANAVKNYLLGQGIAANRVSTVSYGKEFPEVIGSNEESWAKNRRGVTVVN
jgi:peptidoglycan-associated lipoprotein